MIQRCSITRLRITPASNRIASAAEITIVPSRIKDRVLNLRVVTSAIAEMKFGYTPAASNMVPPLIPGTRFASPIKLPPIVLRVTREGTELVSSEGSKARPSSSSLMDDWLLFPRGGLGGRVILAALVRSKGEPG